LTGAVNAGVLLPSSLIVLRAILPKDVELASDLTWYNHVRVRHCKIIGFTDLSWLWDQGIWCRRYCGTLSDIVDWLYVNAYVRLRRRSRCAGLSFSQSLCRFVGAFRPTLCLKRISHTQGPIGNLMIVFIDKRNASMRSGISRRRCHRSAWNFAWLLLLLVLLLLRMNAIATL